MNSFLKPFLASFILEINMKKKLPANLLAKFQPILEKYGHLVVPRDMENSILYLKDRDPKSNFYFKIGREFKTNGVLHYTIDCVPTDANTNLPGSGTYKIDPLMRVFHSWILALVAYEKTTYFDDPILQAYATEFEESWKLNEPDADTAPFDFDRQLFLIGYINQALEDVCDLEEKSTAEDNSQFQDALEEGMQLKEKLGNLTKNETMKLLYRFWAKARKAGIPVIQKILIDLTGSIAVKLIKGETPIAS